MLAGVNGAGKSSIGGAMLRSRPGGDYFNPDERTRQILAGNASLSLAEAVAPAEKPQPLLLLLYERGKVLAPAERPIEPSWAQSIVAAAFDLVAST